MTTLTLQFFSQGSTSPGIEEYLSSKNPYSVTRNNKDAPTALNVETFLTNVQKEPLQNRVHTDARTPNVTVVDKLFDVTVKAEAPRDKAIKIWDELRSGSKTIGILSGVAAAGLILLSLQDLPADIVVSLYVSAVAALCFAGWSLKKYNEAGKELAIWQSPGEDFAQKRKAASELPLGQISLKKCHYHHEKQAEGTLLGIEMLFIFKRSFERFAEQFLARKCDTPEQKQRWVMDFFKANPLVIRFFVDNPHLIEEAGWNDVQTFQQQFDQLLKLDELVLEQFEKDQDTAKQKHAGILKAFKEKAPVVCSTQNIRKLSAQHYFGRVMSALQEECLTKIHEANKEHRKHLEVFYSEVYLQVRPWFEHSYKVLKGEVSAFDANGFAEPAKFLPKDFQQKLDAVTANFPQNVIAKAKEKDPDNAQYCAFVDAVFA